MVNFKLDKNTCLQSHDLFYLFLKRSNFDDERLIFFFLNRFITEKKENSYLAFQHDSMIQSQTKPESIRPQTHPGPNISCSVALLCFRELNKKGRAEASPAHKPSLKGLTQAFQIRIKLRPLDDRKEVLKARVSKSSALKLSSDK